MTIFRLKIRFAAALALVGGLHVASQSLSAGERVIFSNSNSKINVPREALSNTTTTPNSEGFDRGHSSVEGVMAPWQNPMNSSSNVRQRQRILKALDKQKNWMLQDPDELLDSTKLSTDVDLDDIEFRDSNSRYRVGERSAFERYYGKREVKSRFASNRSFRQNSRFRGQNSRFAGNENDFDETEMGDDKEDVKDTFATPKHFESRFDSVFVESTEASEQRVTGTQSITHRGSLPGNQAQLVGFTDPLVDLGIRAPQTSAPQSDFETLLNTTVMDMTSGGLAGKSTGLDAGAGALGGFGAGNQAVRSAMMESFQPGLGSSISETAGFGNGFSGSALGGSQSSAGSGLFDNVRPTSAIQSRPAIFDVPERSF